MDKLNLPEYRFRIYQRENRTCIFDPLRKKDLVLTPEEWVRQNFVQYLVREKKYPQSLTKLEMYFTVNKQPRRSDIVVFKRDGKPRLLVECKAPNVKVDQKVFDQIVRYNMALKADILIVTNGMQHFCCRMDYKENTYHFLKDIPDYLELSL